MSRSFVSGFGEPVATEDPEGYYHLSLWRFSRNDTSETKEAACLTVLQCTTYRMIVWTWRDIFVFEKLHTYFDAVTS